MTDQRKGFIPCDAPDPVLRLNLPPGVVDAFKLTHEILSIAGDGREAPAVMAWLLSILAQTDAAEILATAPAEAAAGTESISLSLPADALADLKALAARVGIEPAEAAARILAGVATEASNSALVAVNSKRITRRRKEGRR